MPEEPHSQQNPLKGIAFKIVSVTLFMGMFTCIKATAGHVPSGEAVFFRSLFAMPPILAWLAWRGELSSAFATNNISGHFFRGLVGVTSMFCGFTALGLIALPEVVIIGYAAPLIATILAAMFLGESLRIYRMTAVFAGLAGVMIILSPRLSVIESGGASATEALGAVIALMAAVFTAMAQIFVRKLVAIEKTTTIVLYFSLSACLLSLITIPWGWVLPEPREALLLISAGFLGGIGQIFLTSSYRHAETSVIASFDYTSVLLALGIGYFIFSEVPTGVMLAGAALVIAGGIVIVVREHQLGLERARARRSMTPQG